MKDSKVVCGAFPYLIGMGVFSFIIILLTTSIFPSRADTGWEASSSDNICGISDISKVSKPAIVSYSRLLNTTPSMKQLIRDGIDPASAEGKILVGKANSTVIKACQKVRKSLGHGSVWKNISHTDGRTVPDITDLVELEINSVR